MLLRSHFSYGRTNLYYSPMRLSFACIGRAKRQSSNNLHICYAHGRSRRNAAHPPHRANVLCLSRATIFVWNTRSGALFYGNAIIINECAPGMRANGFGEINGIGK